ncbi:transcription activator acu-15 [Fusarium mundagurra]|uniref:Transcription activator acu-15 n=1 Tax=Fusarium mundagurra TaxID=1567541 RepID=A0A8H5Z558_9HYPO|nr:transcription activator acu-15 [Fusarium mundagurra]
MPSNACDRCHRRKVRCDKIQPQCGPCKRADVACEYAVSEHQLRRRNVQKLERRIKELMDCNEGLTQQLRRSEEVTRRSEDVARGSEVTRRSEDVERPGTSVQDSPGDGEVAEEVIQMSLIAGGGHHFVGSTSGLLLANLLQSRPQPSSSLTTSYKPNSHPSLSSPQTSSGLPPKTLASELLKAYCSHDHLCYPFLSTKSLYRSLDAVYEDSTAKDPVDAFFVDMTLAIGTAQVHKFNWNGVYDAETHYNRAMTRLADVLARDGIERLQALLLVCQYRMGTTSSNTTTSVWHLIGVAARTCLEMGLHRAATYALPGTLDEAGRKVKEEEMETKRRCFWSLVALDRVTSLALGRPLALQLEDIDVDLPPSSTADQLPDDSSPLSSAPYGTPQYHAATSVFVHIVRYRLICGKIINALHRSAKHVTFPNTSYEEMRTALARELQEWHTETANLPLVKSDTAASPASGSSFRSEEWYRLLYHNGMLMLFRPSPCLNDAAVNSFALQNIYDSAREAISLYASLHRSRKLNYSWITMHSVFLAGLSYIFALRHHFSGSEPQRARLHTTPTINQVVNDTRACSKVLVAVSERWDLARNCSDLFDRLSDAVVADVVEASVAAPVQFSADLAGMTVDIESGVVLWAGRPPIRIGNVSGATGDHPHAMSRMVRSGNVHVITGDWLSEMNIAWNAITKQEVDPNLGYENGFYEQLDECLDNIMQRDIRVVTNAGALNTDALYDKVRALCEKRGYADCVVAKVLGDDVSDVVGRRDVQITHLDHPEQTLESWGFTPCCATAYIGCWGIVQALRSGARIVICGRCTDASPVMGAAAWYHGWREDQYEELAGSLLAAHLIECGPYVVGANFSGFKDFLPELVDIAFPIAEIDPRGRCTIGRTAEGGGRVTKETVIAQLLYELQGHLYLNLDVVADLSGVHVEQESENRVSVSGVKGLPPPSTAKVMIAAKGGFQAEATFYINGLDVYEKAAMMKNQLAHMFKDSNFSRLSIELYGTPAENPTSQQAGTVSLRVFAQARRKEDIDAPKFKVPIYALRMQSYPGYHMNLDFRTMVPKPFMEMFPALMPVSAIEHRVEMSTGASHHIEPPAKTAKYPIVRPSTETHGPVDMLTFGPTEWAPLGSVVHARSGDKGDNSNVGFFVRNDDEYAWLRNLLTVSKLKQLFGDDWFKGDPERRVERVEFPGINAVHFRVLDNLNGGIASSDRIDGLGKGIDFSEAGTEVDGA